MGFGATLQSLRERMGLSQGQLAERAGVSVDSIQNWEQDRTRPRLEALPKLAKALGVALDELVVLNGGNGRRKRGRGRPPKERPADAAEKPKRPRGRPRKTK